MCTRLDDIEHRSTNQGKECLHAILLSRSEATISMIQLEELQRRITHNTSYHLYKPRQPQISKCSPKRVIRL